jgi:plasmid stability protein
VLRSEGVKNITISVPDDVYRAARVQAAEQGSSVSALVADYLRSLSGREAEFERLREQQRRIVAGIEGFRAADNVSRGELHERGIR